MNSEKDTLYARWLAGEISPTELEELRASGELAELEAIIQAADQLALPRYDVERGFEKLKTTRHKPEAKVRRMNRRQILSIAAGFLILAGSVFLLFTGESEVSAGNLANASHKFSDNSSVVLNDGSKIIFDDKNWSNRRLVKLTGEAFFQVEKGAPFLVKTSNGTVEVLGTAFNVRAHGSNFHVECYHGKVRVKNSTEEATLTAGKSVNVIEGKFRDVMEITHQKPLWSMGNARFYEENLNEVFKEMERQFDVKIDAPKFERSFSGTFRHDDLEAALRAVCVPMSLKFEISEDNKTVRIRS